MAIPPPGLGAAVTEGTIYRLLPPTFDYWSADRKRPSSGAFRKDGDIGTSMLLANDDTDRKLATDPRWHEFGIAALDVRRLISDVPQADMTHIRPKKQIVRKISVHLDPDPDYWLGAHVLVIGITAGLLDYVRDLATVVKYPPVALRPPIDVRG